jgi:hypothetical protein
MAEEQPPNVHEGADAAKASAALSSLDRNNDDDQSNNKSADTEALGKAMQSLDVKEPAQEKKEVPKKVKIDAEDVNLLVSRGAEDIKHIWKIGSTELTYPF